MLKMILLGVAALVVILVIVIALRSPDFEVERSMAMNAPAATVFRYVNDPHQLEMMKGMSMFVNMDRMLGDEFTKGLATLKTLTEGETQAADRSS